MGTADRARADEDGLFQLALPLAEPAPAALVMRPAGDGPRCRMCARPARYLAARQEYYMYCAGASCSNRVRLCQQCGEAFVLGVDGAGTKYCSTDCKRLGYRPDPVPRPLCAWGCGQQRDKPLTGAPTWPYICDTCTGPIKHLLIRLKDHHVPHERARRLLDDPTCEVCGIDIVTKQRDQTGKLRALLVVDHDHACCPVTSHSCGLCIRGLICRGCNAAAGILGDDPGTVRALARYLDQWQRS